MTTKTGDLMTIPELQQWLGGLGRSKTYELIRTGEIRSYRVGRLLRVRRGLGVRFPELRIERFGHTANRYLWQ